MTRRLAEVWALRNKRRKLNGRQHHGISSTKNLLNHLKDNSLPVFLNVCSSSISGTKSDARI
jgi:hypothetical protein